MNKIRHVINKKQKVISAFKKKKLEVRRCRHLYIISVWYISFVISNIPEIHGGINSCVRACMSVTMVTRCMTPRQKIRAMLSLQLHWYVVILFNCILFQVNPKARYGWGPYEGKEQKHGKKPLLPSDVRKVASSTTMRVLNGGAAKRWLLFR